MVSLWGWAFLGLLVGLGMLVILCLLVVLVVLDLLVILGSLGLLVVLDLLVILGSLGFLVILAQLALLVHRQAQPFFHSFQLTSSPVNEFTSL